MKNNLSKEYITEKIDNFIYNFESEIKTTNNSNLLGKPPYSKYYFLHIKLQYLKDNSIFNKKDLSTVNLVEYFELFDEYGLEYFLKKIEKYNNLLAFDYYKKHISQNICNKNNPQYLIFLENNLKLKNSMDIIFYYINNFYYFFNNDKKLNDKDLNIIQFKFSNSYKTILFKLLVYMERFSKFNKNIIYADYLIKLVLFMIGFNFLSFNKFLYDFNKNNLKKMIFKFSFIFGLKFKNLIFKKTKEYEITSILTDFNTQFNLFFEDLNIIKNTIIKDYNNIIYSYCNNNYETFISHYTKLDLFIQGFIDSKNMNICKKIEKYKTELEEYFRENDMEIKDLENNWIIF